jgi:hypothetical protein
VKPQYRSLVYQWAIHLASALEYIHSHSAVLPVPHITIVFGDLVLDCCWLGRLSDGLPLSVMGFINSGFRTRSSALHLGDIPRRRFDPTADPDMPGRNRPPTHETDLFFWGCVVYQLMTGSEPGDGQGLDQAVILTLVGRREWPTLEREFLGDVVRMCWKGEIGNAADLLTLVRQSVSELGVAIRENDEVVDISMEGLTI